MKYWERWIGDWKRDTAHLPLIERGAYSELLDHLYASDSPELPLSIEETYRIAGAITKEEQAAVKNVVERFFPAGKNARAEREIKRRLDYVEKQRVFAIKRWHPDAHPDTNPHGYPQHKGGNGSKPMTPKRLSNLGRCSYCADPATTLTNSIAHCGRGDHFDMAIAKRR